MYVNCVNRESGAGGVEDDETVSWGPWIVGTRDSPIRSSMSSSSSSSTKDAEPLKGVSDMSSSSSK